MIGTLSFASPPARAAGVDVIPPGQEALVQTMLTLPDGAACERGDITIERQRIRTTVTCAGAVAAVELHHVSQADALESAVKTTQFAVLTTGATDAHQPILDTIMAQIRANEAGFRWVAASQGVARAPTDLPSPAKMEKRDGDPLWDRYHTGYELFRKKRHVEAFEHFMAMAKEHPHYAGVLGMLVANLAPQQPDRARVKAMQATADANPDSPLLNFLAGVAAHYSAHYKAETVDEKKQLYADAIKYIEKARPAFDKEPRVFIYLAVSHFRLGHQAEAEKLIEQGVALNHQDPDAYYCRAEIFHRTQHERAIQDIDKYLELTEAEGGVSSGKVQRVKNMRAYLVRVQNGEQQMTELWDPISGDNYEIPAEAATFTRSGRWVLLGLAALVLLASVGFYAIRRRSAR